MKYLLSLTALLFGVAVAAPAGSGINFHEETLHYSVNWPSGLSLGEAFTKASKVRSGGPEGDRWKFEFQLDAGIPGFQVSDHITSLASADGFCSVELEKDSNHGKRSAKEKTTIDAANGVATRETINGGGKSEIPVGPCVHDGLTFLFYLRNELAQGRIPPPQVILFGAPYQLRLEYGGAKTIPIGGVPSEADRFVASLKGPASQSTFELFIARDAARTPLLIRVPLPMGSFSMELTR
jgi:hypothetical protein